VPLSTHDRLSRALDTRIARIKDDRSTCFVDGAEDGSVRNSSFRQPDADGFGVRR
jgi:hypothetical protein